MGNIEELEIFAKVAETRSMSATARALGLSPAVISKRVRRLEDRLGARLLQRTTRQIMLTEAGQGLYTRVLSILSGIEEAELFVSGRSSTLVGALRITAPTSFGRLHIAPHLSAFMLANPQLSLDLILSDEFIDIVAGGFDVAIRISEPKDSTLIARKLVKVRRVLCAAPDYLATYGMPQNIGDLAQHRCLPAHNGEPWRLDTPQGPLVYRPEGMLKTNSSEVIREAVIAGLGIALRSTWDIGEELRNGRLVQVLPGFEGSRNVWISAVYPTRAFLPSKVRAFIDYLAAIYGPTPPWDDAD